MIRYALKCAADHQFESWFQSADAYASLAAAGHVACPVCGSAEVAKDLMSPNVRPARKAAATPVPSDPPATPAGPLSAPASEAEAAMTALRQKIEANSDYVGLNFAAEARAMHEGETEHRSIYGEAKPADAKKLLEDGVPVAPLPFVPSRKSN